MPSIDVNSIAWGVPFLSAGTLLNDASSRRLVLDKARGESPTIDRDEINRRLLVMLARTQVAMDAGPDAELAQLHRCVQAGLFILECDVPWVQGEQDTIQWWAERPDEYAESQIVQDLLCSGLAGIALGRLQPALRVYHWLRTAVQDARDVHLVWGVALLGAQRWSEARACFSQLDARDDLAQALMAVVQLSSAPAKAVWQLKRVQACCVEPPVRELVRSVLETLDRDGYAADPAECDVVAWSAWRGDYGCS